MLASIPATMNEFPRGSDILKKHVNECVLSHRSEEVTKCVMCDRNVFSDATNTVCVSRV